MTPATLALRPPFFTRIAMLAMVLWFLGFFVVEVSTPGPGKTDEPLFTSPLDVGSFALFVGLLLWVSWRNWRMGVDLTESEVTVKGFFRDRTVPRSAVRDLVET